MYTCAECYMFMLPSGFTERAKAFKVSVHGVKVWHLLVGNVTVAADANDPYSPLVSTFRTEAARNNWRACCDQARDCCRNMLADNSTTAAGWCPRTWDGWLCWQDAPPHTSQSAACPAFIALGSEPPSCMFASKKCESAGRWFLGENGNEWTNYSTCSLVPNLRKRAYVSIAAYAVTIVAIVPALAIFSIYRQLRVARVALHRQLFASLLLNAAAVIAFKSLVLLPQTEQNPLIQQDSVTCKLLLLATKYLRLTNYMWMFCEGFYLHRLISAAFVEHNSLLLFYLIGWGLPLLPLSIYVVVRVLEDRAADLDGLVGAQCWAFPQGLSEKTVRATLVLVPLFGLHLSLTMYRPASGSCSGTFIQWYYMIDYLLDGLQGFLVALTFCYCNGEVHYLLRRSYQRFMLRHGPGLMHQSWASSAAVPGASHTTMSLAEPPCPRSRNNCCSVNAAEDTPPPAHNGKEETGI
ncbi:hypothetical protein B566_EDAN011139 [Ephemera danica]|nr:hypothetical protein B566_EDAN011139 [Ephemera danica]